MQAKGLSKKKRSLQEEGRDRLSQDVQGQGHRTVALHPAWTRKPSNGGVRRSRQRPTRRPLRGAATSARATVRPSSPSTSAMPTTWPSSSRTRPSGPWSAARNWPRSCSVAPGRGLSARRPPRFAEEIETLRFGLKPSAVYFNPTERCNLNCTYCYIPEDMRRRGQHMSRREAASRPWRFSSATSAPPCPRARCRRSSSTGPSRC